MLDTAPAPSFDDPLEMLRACHGRIRAQCATLHKLQQYLSLHGCDAQTRQAAQNIMRYFDSAGLFHHLDEEQDLFPMLLACSNSAAHGLVAQLLKEHQPLDAAWKALRPCLAGIAQDDRGTLDEAMVEDFSAAYDRHIELENTRLLPLAASLLEASQLQVLGRSMAARRGG